MSLMTAAEVAMTCAFDQVPDGVSGPWNGILT